MWRQIIYKFFRFKLELSLALMLQIKFYELNFRFFVIATLFNLYITKYFVDNIFYDTILVTFT